jgi:ribokinase
MITVVGSFVMDMVARMDRFPQAGETLIGQSVQYFPGGKGANQCVAAARLGGKVQMVGMLGEDAYGRQFREILIKDGIGDRHVFACQLPTAVAQVQINAQGQNRIVVIPSANHAFGYEELDQVDDLLRQSQLVVLQLEMRLDVTMEIIRRCHSYGVPVVLNPAPAVPLEPEILAMVTYLTPNETELAILSGMPTDTLEQQKAAARHLNTLGVKTCIATLGEAGALVSTMEEQYVVPAYRVDAVDTVAAGDSFNGALAVAITEGKLLREAVQFANAMAALTVQVSGAIPSLHNRSQVEAFMQAQ